MLLDLFRIKSFSIEGSNRLYPNGIDWELRPGINVIVGGTGLGKTTLVNALLFGLFGPLGQSSKQSKLRNIPNIGSEYFHDRLGSTEQAMNPSILVVAEIGDVCLHIKRDLITGKIIELESDGGQVALKNYEDILVNATGLTDFKNQLLHLVDHLLYVGEHRYLVAWDNQIQNEVMTLLFREPAEYQNVNDLWEKAQSADSSFRNLRHHAGIAEKNFEELRESSLSSVENVEVRRTELQSASRRAENQRDAVRSRFKDEKNKLQALQNDLDELQWQYDELAWKIDETSELDADLELANNLASSPNAKSTYAALLRIASQPGKELCPSCGRMPSAESKQLRAIQKLVENGQCPLCAGEYRGINQDAPTSQNNNAISELEKEIRAVGKRLMKKAVEREKTSSRLVAIEQEVNRTEGVLQSAREAEWHFRLDAPPSFIDAIEAKRLTMQDLRERSNKEEDHRNRYVSELQRVLNELNKNLSEIDAEIAACFSHFAGMFLDQKCEVEFDKHGTRTHRPGPQLDPPHSAFFPIVDDVPRNSPDTLSEAQRLFMDLAFRMALLDVWHKRTGKTTTVVVETPEGSVDIAYMSRVATMLSAFSEKGHSLIVTTNLNNYEFLPSLLSSTPQKEREGRILNLLDKGNPNPIQVQFADKFSGIIKAATAGEG
jgi:energy-coupling factor transporter ATP-binding protein EcfA2